MFVAFMRNTLQQGKFDRVFRRFVDRPGQRGDVSFPASATETATFGFGAKPPMT